MPDSANEKTDDNALSGAASRSASLVKKARQGSRNAFHELVHLYQGAVFRMVYYRTRSQMDAEDLTQDIFLKAFKNLHRLKEAERFRGWLFRIALNRIRDFNRKKRFRAMFKATSDSDDLMAGEFETNDGSETLEQYKRLEQARVKLGIERFHFLLKIREIVGFEGFQKLMAFKKMRQQRRHGLKNRELSDIGK